MARSAHVAEVSEKDGLGHPLPIRLSRITRYEGQPRRYFDPASLQELADSIHGQGQKTPVRVCKHSKQPGVFILIGGERRWRAFHLIQERTGKEPVVNAFVDVVKNEREHFQEALLDNLQREDLIAPDEAASYKRLYDDLDKTWTKSARISYIANLVKKSVSHVTNYIAIDSLPFPVKQLMDPARPKDKQLGVTAAIEIAKSTNNGALQLKIAQEAIERNLGIDETRMLISMRTGKSSFGVNGSTRSPRDDYRSLRAFFNSSLSKMRHLRMRFNLDDLYASREDEDEDRKTDLVTIKLLISGLQDMQKEIEETT